MRDHLVYAIPLYRSRGRDLFQFSTHLESGRTRTQVHISVYRVTCTHIHTLHSLSRDCYTQTHICVHRHRQPFPPHTSPVGLYACTCGITRTYTVICGHTQHTFTHTHHTPSFLSSICSLTRTQTPTFSHSHTHVYHPPVAERDELTLIWDPAQLRL